MPIKFSSRLAQRYAKTLKSETEPSRKKYPGEGTLYQRKRARVITLLGGECGICGSKEGELFIVMSRSIPAHKKSKVDYLLKNGCNSYDAHLECKACYYY